MAIARMIKPTYSLGIDIGSTTVKIAVLDADKNVLFSDYERHFANIRETLLSLVQKAYDKLGRCNTASDDYRFRRYVFIKSHLTVPFVQEVIAVSTALARLRTPDRRSHRTWW